MNMNSTPDDYIDLVFDGPPGPEGCRFVEVENSSGRSIRIGEWVQRPNGTWALRLWAADLARRADRKKFMDDVAEAFKRAGERVRREGPSDGRFKPGR
jgi:hypothetical protein